MATAAPPPQPPPSSSSALTLESLKCVDIRELSQSELYALSLCSTSAFNLRRSDDVVVPQIDRSLFNESSGSRRQTYSRIRHTHHRTTRLPGLLPNSDPKPKPSSSADPDNHSILHFLKHLLHHGLNSTPPPPPTPPLPLPEEVVSITPQQFELELGLGFDEKLGIGKHLVDRKRKRGRKRKVDRGLMENGVGEELEVVNKKGEVVDLAVLENDGDNFYSEELKKRTVGLQTEEGILGFLTSLEGQWCSRRKKRKYVDASEFGDMFPIGWKLLLSLRRRDGVASVYCRRYISPFGQQFLSCKEAAPFLRSHFFHPDSEQPMDHNGSSIQENAGISPMLADVELNIVPYNTLPSSTTSDLPGNELFLLGLENLSEVKVQDLFECYKCNLSFDEKDAYLEHLFSFHQQTTKRVKFGGSVGEGVMVKIGQFECQFCHKVFDDLHKYNDHVEVHVKNYRGPEELGGPSIEKKSIESLVQQDLASRTSKIGVSVENGRTTLETSTALVAGGSTGNSCPGITSSSKDPTLVTHLQMNLGSNPCEMPTEDSNDEGAPPQQLNRHDVETVDVGDTVGIKVNADTKSNNEFAYLAVDNMEKHGNGAIKVNFSPQDDNVNDDTIVDTTGLVVEASDLQNEAASSSELFMDSLDYFPAFSTASDKGDNEFRMVDPKLQSETGFEELRLGGIESFSFAEVQGSSSLDQGFNSPVRFHPEEVILNMEGGQLTSLCVWCRSEFKLEGVDSETQSDTIGYMCPTCKDKISGHLDGGYP